MNAKGKSVEIVLLSAVLLCSAHAQQQLQMQLLVTSDPVGAVVFCDGVVQGSTPLTISQLSAGTHLITVRLDGYRTARRSVTISEGQRLPVHFKLEPIQGLVLIHSDPPGAGIEVNGAYRGKTPLFVGDLALGKYRLKLTVPGYLPKEIDLELKDRTPRKVYVSLISDSATLVVDSRPQGASVTISGIQKGTTPCTIERIQAGECTVEWSLSGHMPFQRSVKLAPGETQGLQAVLKPIPATLQVVSIPEGARVYLNNQFRGTAPLTIGDLQPGTYRLRAEMRGFDPLARNVELNCGQSQTEEFRFESTTGAFLLTTEPPDVRVFLNAKEVAVTPLRGDGSATSGVCRIEKIEAGEHEIRLVKKGYAPAKFNIVIEKGKVVERHEKLRRQFAADYEVVTRTGIFRGALVERDARGNVTLEIAEGVTKMFRAEEIRGQRRLPARTVE